MTEPVAMVEVEQKLFEEVKAQQARVTESRSTYEAAKSRAKYCKEALENDQTTLESLIRRLISPEQDLPLFANQSEAIDAAKADPEVTKLVERLIGHGHYVNLLIVAGYTPEERQQAAEYCDAVDKGDVAVIYNVPAFLIPQDLTPVEVADFIVRLERAGQTVAAETISEFTAAERAEILDWLTRVEALQAEKGDALTFDDLPAAPACVVEAAANGPDGEAEETPAEDDTAVDDEPQPENLPPPARGRRRRSSEAHA